MTTETSAAHEMSRRSLLAALGVGGAAAAIGVGVPASARGSAPGIARDSVAGTQPVATPPVAGLHVQFGDDPATQMTVSWHSTQPVAEPRVVLARDGHGYERSEPARVRTYTDAKSGQVVYAQHARIARLRSDTTYVYAAVHDGAAPQFGSFRTAPAGRSPFTFTSFGDQGTPTLGKIYTRRPAWRCPSRPSSTTTSGSPAAGDTTAGVERVAPLLHLFNGDLCYANLATDRVRTWQDFWNNNTRRSAAQQNCSPRSPTCSAFIPRRASSWSASPTGGWS